MSTFRSQIGVLVQAPPCPAADSDPLVGLLREGDPAAIGVAYDRLSGPVRRLARHMLGEDASAEDLLQEVFLVLPEAIRKFRGDSSFETFVLSIVVNRAKMFIRSSTRRRRLHQHASSEEVSGACSPDPESCARQRELADALFRAMDLLSDDQRAAFVLCDIEERTSAEASTILNAPESTVRTRLFHARRKLRERLDAEGIR